MEREPAGARGSDSPAQLDGDAAWRLVLALNPGEDGVEDPASGSRLRLPGPDTWETDPPAGREAETILEMFLPLRRRSAFVVGQLGQSLDGRIATETGHSHYINGPEDIRRLHRLRALADAVVVGAGTVMSDDPRLTVREVEGPDPVRVVLDPSGRLDPERGVFRDGRAPTLWIRSEAKTGPSGGGDSGPPTAETREVKPSGPGDEARPGQPSGTGDTTAPVEVIRLPCPDASGFDPAAVLETLADRGLHRVLVEGGGVTVSRFLLAGALDRLHLSVAPLILGSGLPGIRLPPIRTLDEAMRPPVRHFLLGTDLLFDLDLAAGRS